MIMPTRMPWITAVALVLTACGSPASHSESSMNPWPSLLGAPARFVTSDNFDLWPCFSPDGARVLFSRRAEDGWELLLVSVNGGSPRKLARSPLPVAATRANWSKQDLIAFTGTSSANASGIWIIKSDGSSPRELHLSGLSNQMFYPSWFPDGEQLAAMDAQDFVIKRIDLRKGTVVTLTDNRQVFTGMPSVSPDGKSIIFAGQKNTGQHYDQSNNQIWLMDEAGVSHALESVPAQGRAPVWSPSGRQIAFESTRGSASGLYAIFLINRDGTGLTQVTDRALNADHPVWSPDGRHLAFSARRSTLTRDRSIAVIDIPNN
jgi:Tol biopolymer transport system component